MIYFCLTNHIIMKKVLFILAICVASFVQAQDGIPKGSLYSGFSLNFYNQTQDRETKSGLVTVSDEPIKTMDFGIRPEVIYFIMDNVALGLYLGMDRYKQTYSSMQGNTKFDYENTSGGVSYGLYGRKYWNCTENFYTFVGLGLNGGSGKGENKTTNTVNNISTTPESKYSNMNFGLSAGLTYQITPKLLLQGNFGLLNFYTKKYRQNILNDNYTENIYKGIEFNVASGNVPFNLGFLYLLNSKG